MHNIKHSFIKC